MARETAGTGSHGGGTMRTRTTIFSLALVLAAGMAQADQPSGFACDYAAAPAGPAAPKHSFCADLKYKLFGRWIAYNSCGAGKGLSDFGCTGVRSECTFIFGSCCEFYGEEPGATVFRRNPYGYAGYEDGSD